MLGNGFIVTAVLWSSALVFIIERRLTHAAAVWAAASAATLFGVVHSPHPSGAVFWPWAAPATALSGRVAGAYGVLAVLCLTAGARLSSRRRSR